MMRHLEIFKRAGLLWAVCALSAAALQAHNFWIEPSTFTPAPAQRVAVRLRVGQELQGDPVPRDPALMKRFLAAGPAGDLPVPGGLKRRDGSPLYRPAFPALVSDRVRWVGDYVAFVVAETHHQALDAAELIAVDYEPLPAITSAIDAIAPGAPLVFDDCPNNICFVQLEGDKAATDASFAQAAHVVKHRLVINRVTAASMEPRGSIGIYHPAEGRYTIHTTLQRAHTFREELARNVLRLPENKLRVVAGDIGGSFGMKSAVYNEVALVLLGAKLTGRPVKWISTRSEAFLSDGQARDNVVDAELAGLRHAGADAGPDRGRQSFAAMRTGGALLSTTASN